MFLQKVLSHIPPQKKTFLVLFLFIFVVIYVSHDQFDLKQLNLTYRIVQKSEAGDDQPLIRFFESELVENNSNSIPPKAVLMVRSKGYGLGNHLFLYAESYALSRNLKIPLVIPFPSASHVENSKNFTDREFVLDHFSLPKAIYVDFKEIQKKTNTYRATCQMAKNTSLIPEKILNNTQYYAIGGICFSDNYFKNFENEITQIKVKVERPSESYLKWKELITSAEWPIAVHVRRGDIEYQYWSAPREYFHEALRRMKQKTPQGFKQRVFVFSDDIKWAKENILGEGFFPAELEWPIYFVSDSFGGLFNIEEMDLMIRCKSIIISNSTFSWWAAYLMKDSGEHKKIVIRPQFNATKHKNDPLGWNGKNRRNYAIGYPSEWIAIDT